METMPMIWIVLAIAVVSFPFVLASVLKRSVLRIGFADQAWGSLEKHATQLLNDRSLNSDVGDFVEFVLNKSGSGWMTRAFLLFVIFRGGKGKSQNSFKLSLAELSSGQRQHFFRFMVDAILYDSLRAGLSGMILRRVVYWLVNTAKNEREPITASQVEPIARAAGRYYQPA